MNIIIAQWSKNMARKLRITSSNHLGGLFIFAELNIWKLQFMHHARYHNQVIFAEFTIVSHLKEIYKMEIRPKCLTLIILVLLFTFRLEKELANFLIKVWWTRYSKKNAKDQRKNLLGFWNNCKSVRNLIELPVVPLRRMPHYQV